MLENVQQILDEFKANLIREAKRNLSAQNTSGRLKDSLKGYVKESKNSIQISFEMEDYGFYQDQGVKGVKSGKSLGGYRYTRRGGQGSLKGMPPPRAFDKWTVRKGIAPRDKEGRFIKRKSLNFLIARSIFNKGIKPTLFFTRPFEKYFKRLPDEMIEKYGLDMEKLFDQITDENFKRLAK
jgi:hypothetical protein